MSQGARTPEELELLLEDAFVTRDREALAGLFEEGAVLDTGGTRQACGGKEIGQVAEAMWRADRRYLADPQQILQARDTALVVAERSISVVRRGGDGTWRYAISLLSLKHNGREEQ
jgi:Domain of unknown function (DUF4440)